MNGGQSALKIGHTISQMLRSKYAYTISQTLGDVNFELPVKVQSTPTILNFGLK